MNLMSILLQAAGAGQQGGGASMWVMLLLMIVIFYFFMIRPQSKKAKEERIFRDGLQKGDKVLTHIQICELNGELLADIEDYFAIGSSDLPIAINRSLRQMGLGEEMRIIAPWYTAYGAEGTSLIKPYSNLIITLTTIEE